VAEPCDRLPPGAPTGGSGKALLGAEPLDIRDDVPADRADLRHLVLGAVHQGLTSGMLALSVRQTRPHRVQRDVRGIADIGGQPGACT